MWGLAFLEVFIYWFIGLTIITQHHDTIRKNPQMFDRKDITSRVNWNFFVIGMLRVSPRSERKRFHGIRWVCCSCWVWSGLEVSK